MPKRGMRGKRTSTNDAFLIFLAIGIGGTAVAIAVDWLIWPDRGLHNGLPQENFLSEW